ncbi:MAG: hypothetical protein NTX65_04855 [Ignavibacteriales bacterium]|nr:hypothetical protein [Ignavibacteriales bacterium]
MKVQKVIYSAVLLLSLSIFFYSQVKALPEPYEKGPMTESYCNKDQAWDVNCAGDSGICTSQHHKCSA